jgi:hypothetical protein
LVGIQPQIEGFLTDGHFSSKHVGVKANFGLGVIKEHSTISKELLQIKVFSHSGQIPGAWGSGLFG